MCLGTVFYYFSMPKIKTKFYREAKLESDSLIRKLRSESLTLNNHNESCSSVSSKHPENTIIDLPAEETVSSHDISDTVETDDIVYDVNSADLREEEIVFLNNNVESVTTRGGVKFEYLLSHWAITNGTKMGALSELLQILKKIPQLEYLPGDARSLLKTPRQIKLKTVDPGYYFHFGLEECIIKLLDKNNAKLLCDTVEVIVNIDGLPISKSSGSQLYPILVSLFDDTNVEIVGIYHGLEKPINANRLLEHFVQDAIALTNNGFLYKNKTFNFKIKAFVCDAPAKSYITFVKGHTGYSSCTKCYQTGMYAKNRICFPETENIIKRNDREFRNKTDEDYHLSTESSLLELLPAFDMVNGFPLDYMHLICLGVMRKLIMLWCCGTPKTKLCSRDTNIISNQLIQQRKFVPCEFNRKPRSLVEIRRWKATECRQFLLYTGPVVLKNVLDRKRYLNFMCLHIACRILLSQHYSEYLEYADALMKYFVQTFIQLYGKEYVSHNIHNLLHIVSDVKYFNVPMDKISAYKFENYMQTIKKRIRKADKPLTQIALRKFEEDAVSSSCSNVSALPITPVAKQEHNSGPITNTYSFTRQFRQVSFVDFTLKSSESDNCCTLKCGDIFIIKNVVQKIDCKLFFIGCKYLSTSSFYTSPCNSSDLHTFVVSNLSNTLEIHSINEVLHKNVRFKISQDRFVVFPLLHTHN